MSSLSDALYEIESGLDAAKRAEDDVPGLDKDELESRLSDLESEARSLTSASLDDLETDIIALADAIHELYSEV